MGFDGEVPIHVAVILTLFAASLWGTWIISLKHLGDFPIEGFIVTVYVSAFVMVWSIAIIVRRVELPRELSQGFRDDPIRMFSVIAGGIAFAVGMGVTLGVLSKIGMSVAQPIQSSVSIILGTIITVSIGGLPEGVSLTRLIFAVSLLICAVISTVIAAWFRAQAWKAKDAAILNMSMAQLYRVLPLMLLASVLSSAYPWALSIGLKSPTQSHGLTILPYMTLLVSGALIGAFAINGVNLTRRRQWRLVLTAPFHVRRWGMASGVFHFGGNIIHGVGASSLSTSIAYPLGLSSTFWSLLVGLLHGEFKGASTRAHIAMGAAMLLYCTGVGVIVSTL